MSCIDIFTTENIYDVIAADPPWPIKKGGRKGVRPNSSGRPLDYKTMTMEQIEDHLRRSYELLDDNGTLFLWTIEKYLIDAQQIAERVGFKLHCRMIWDKSPMGMATAFTLRFSHEYLLWMVKGKLQPIAEDERGQICSVFHAQPGIHSEKPLVSFNIMERLYPDARRLEMYAREERPGWDAFGNEIQMNLFCMDTTWGNETCK